MLCASLSFGPIESQLVFFGKLVELHLVGKVKLLRDFCPEEERAGKKEPESSDWTERSPHRLV